MSNLIGCDYTCQRKKNIKPTTSFVQEFEDYLVRLREISL